METSCKSSTGREASVPEPTDTGMPRWVVVFGMVAFALFLVFVTVHLAGGGLHHHGANLPGAATARLRDGQP